MFSMPARSDQYVTPSIELALFPGNPDSHSYFPNIHDDFISLIKDRMREESSSSENKIALEIEMEIVMRNCD